MSNIWSEREVMEMDNIIFYNKSDSRNLLLIYGENFKPILKKNNTLGNWEFYYNIISSKVIKKSI